MRKADLYKKINRNTIFSSSNRVSPQHILTSDPIWMEGGEQARPSGVQIVELRSSASDRSGNDEDNEQRCPSSQNDNYMINETARERRRKRNETYEIPSTFQDKSSHMTQFEKDYIYANYLYCDTSGMDNENVIYNYNQADSFTIYDKHLTNSDNSAEDRGDMEFIQCGTPSQDSSCDPATDWNIAPMCDEFADADNEKRTVWIYSFKNKHLLSQNDFELINIPSTSSSIEIEELDDPKAIYRKSTRIPTPFLPGNISKLKSPILSPVTEYTEEQKSFLSSKIEINVNKGKFSLKGNKNWFSAQVSPKSGGDTMENKSSNVLHWMALSPRDKKRRFRHVSNPIPFHHDINIMPTVKEATSTAENIEELSKREDTRGCGDKETVFEAIAKDHDDVKVAHDQATNTDFSSTSKTSVQKICAAVKDSARKSAKSLRSNVSSVIGNLTALRELENYLNSPPETSNIRKKNDSKDTAIDSEVCVTIREKANTSPNTSRDDFSKRKVPRISIPITPAVKLPADSTENLKNCNWIQEEKLINDDRIRTPTDGKGDRASDALWAKNMALLKPAEWTAYMPIAESIPSLHLSMNTDSIDGTQTWFRRMVKCFRCCK